MNVTLNPQAEHIDLVTFAAECRNCGGALAPLAMSRTDGCVAWLPVACVETGCHRHYALKVEMIAVTDPAKSDMGHRFRGRVPA